MSSIKHKLGKRSRKTLEQDEDIDKDVEQIFDQPEKSVQPQQKIRRTITSKDTSTTRSSDAKKKARDYVHMINPYKIDCFDQPSVCQEVKNEFTNSLVRKTKRLDRQLTSKISCESLEEMKKAVPKILEQLDDYIKFRDDEQDYHHHYKGHTCAGHERYIQILIDHENALDSSFKHLRNTLKYDEPEYVISKVYTDTLHCVLDLKYKLQDSSHWTDR